MPENKEPQRIRIVCPLDGYESFWIEYDAGEWGIGHYMRLHGDDMSVARVLKEFIPRWSVDWHIENPDGTVIQHPGPKASEVLWRTVWDQLAVELRTLFPWFWMSALSAMQEAMSLPKKSLAPDSGAGRGQEDTAGRDESDGPA